MRSLYLPMLALCICLVVVFTPRIASALCVRAFQAELKTGPGEEYPTSRLIVQYTPLKIVKKKNGWLQVQDVDGQQHWIHKKQVTRRYRCATTKTAKSNLRKGPGSKYAKVYDRPLSKYSSFRVLGKRGSWLKVQEQFVKSAWIHKDLVWIQ